MGEAPKEEAMKSILQHLDGVQVLQMMPPSVERYHRLRNVEEVEHLLNLINNLNSYTDPPPFIVDLRHLNTLDTEEIGDLRMVANMVYHKWRSPVMVVVSDLMNQHQQLHEAYPAAVLCFNHLGLTATQAAHAIARNHAQRRAAS